MGQSKFSVFAMLRARLSWKITLWVFLSIVVVEIILLLPSLARREQEILIRLQTLSMVTMVPLAHFQSGHLRENLLEVARMLPKQFPVLGGAIFRRDGGVVAEFGDAPEWFSTEAHLLDQMAYQHTGERYDTFLLPEPGSEAHILTELLLTAFCREQNLAACPKAEATVFSLRFDSEPVSAELRAYTWRIIGLIAIICLFVTAVMMLVLGFTLILPVLRLRQALFSVVRSADSGNLQSAASLRRAGERRKDELGDVMQAFSDMSQEIHRYVGELKAREAELQIAHDQAEKLLLNILPAPIAAQLKNGIYPIAEHFPEVTVLFADLVGFTELSAKISPAELIELLNRVFTSFDHLAERHGLEKIKTVGDAYLVVAGIPTLRPDHAEAIADMALDMLEEIRCYDHEKKHSLSIRIGIHAGPVVAGVIGIKKFIYDLWGDTVNTASRMESHGVNNAIQVSDTIYQRLQHRFVFEARGLVHIKGKGDMCTYLLVGRLPVALETS